MKKGKLIVIDGTDGSGKATQVKLLVKRLKKSGRKVKAIDFPQYYDNFFGKTIGECLIGENGNWAKINPRIASVLYAADRWESSKKVKKWLKGGYFVIADRHASSNQIHQGGKVLETKKSALALVKEKNNRIRIDCVKKGRLLSVDQVGDLVWQEIKEG